MGVGTYRPLDNLKYQQEFQYEPVKLEADGSKKRDNAIYISTSNLISELRNDILQADVPYLALNVAYIPEDKRRTLNFDTQGGKPIFTR